MSKDEERYLTLRMEAEALVRQVREMGIKLGMDEDDILSDVEDILANVGFSKTSVT
jgi:hypothetical protein